MLRYNLVGKIRRNSTKEVEALDVPLWGSITAIPNDSSTTLQTGNLWAYAPNGSYGFIEMPLFVFRPK